MNGRQIKRKLAEILGISSNALIVFTTNLSTPTLGEELIKLITINYNGNDFPSWLIDFAENAESLIEENITHTRITLSAQHWEDIFNHPLLPTFITPRPISWANRNISSPTTIAYDENESPADLDQLTAAMREPLDFVPPRPENLLSNLANIIKRGRPKVYTNCLRCGIREKKQDLIQVSLGEFVCSSCIEGFNECFNCCRYFLTFNEGLITGNMHSYCGNCQSRVWTCPNCDIAFDTDEYVLAQGTKYCRSCSTRALFNCRGCAELAPLNRRYDCPTCSYRFCRDCQREHSLECGYRELPEPPTFFKGKPENSQLPFGRFVGIEIEAEKGELSRLVKKMPSYVGIVRDGSLHDKGIEIVTPPANYDEVERIVKDVTAILKENGFKGTVNCGLHLHFDAGDIIKDHIKIVQIIKTFYAMEDILYSMLPPSRWSPDSDRKNYCQRLSEDYLYKSFRKEIKKGDFEKEWYKTATVRQANGRKHHKYDESRYYGLNIHSIFYRGTIELRYHSGTVEDYKIINWVNITSRMIEYAINRYKQSEVEWFYNTETSYEKFKRFTHLMDFPSSLKDYMQNRINKFNPDFRVKFNMGKVLREKERRALTLKRRKIEKAIDSYYPAALKKVKEDLRNQGDTRQSPRRIRQYALNLASEMAKKNLPSDLFNLPVDGGFLKNKDLEMIRFFMEKGREMVTAFDNSADEPGL